MTLQVPSTELRPEAHSTLSNASCVATLLAVMAKCPALLEGYMSGVIPLECKPCSSTE